MSLYAAGGKRAIDIIVSAALMPLVGISTLIVAALIRLDDNGPIFYTATRRGKNGAPFPMYKYRSMRVGAPARRAADHSVITTTNDDRVTRTGRFLRSTSLDELPQLINVLKGDMSLIGPRPDLAGRDYAQLSPDEQHRLLVRPGITGYTQAHYRNSIPAAEKYRHDAWYVDHLSAQLDARIILTTIRTVLRRHNITNDAPKATT